MLFKKLKLSPVLGYLVAGMVIGDHGYKLIMSESISFLAEFGIVFLLFAIGLELSFERLKAMRQYVFGLGSLQIIITAIVVALASLFFTKNINTILIIGGGLALSSTAIVLQVLEELKSQSTQLGRVSLGILIQQDFIVVPLLVIVPLLAEGNTINVLEAVAKSFGQAILVLAVIFVAGRMFLRPLLSMISLDSPSGVNEIFIATTLLIVLSSAWGTEYFNLSLALGAFVAGVLVAETEFRQQAEESIYPFKGLLLGLFFMSVGMTIDVIEIYNKLWIILGSTACLVAVKAIIITGLCLCFGMNKGIAIQSGLLLSQGGELAFILFKLASKKGVIDPYLSNILMTTVTCSMAITPLLAIIGKKINIHLNKDDITSPNNHIRRTTADMRNHIIIAGFGATGKMVANVFSEHSYAYIGVDIIEDTCKKETEDGYSVVCGDITQLSTILALGANRAKAIVVTIENYITALKATKIISKNFPEITIIVRTKTLEKETEFYESGATIIVPHSYEAGLELAATVMKVLGVSDSDTYRVKSYIRSNNYMV